MSIFDASHDEIEDARSEAYIEAQEQHLDDECEHKYAETHLGTGVKCIICGHFVGNWET